MFQKKLLILSLMTIACLYSCAQQPAVNSDVEASLKAISSEAIKATVTYLADDKLLGRYPGTKGYDQAVEYVVDQLKINYIEPAGDNGTYLQKVRTRKGWSPASSVTITSQGKSDLLEVNKDYVIYPHFDEKSITIDAPIVFAGYGISLPESNYDDYANQDVKGKIVLVLRGAPQKFDPLVALNLMSVTRILSTAAEHGAIGVIIGASMPALRAANNVNATLFPNGKVASSGSYITPAIKLYATISESLLSHLFQNGGLDTTAIFAQIKGGKPFSKPLNTRLKASYTSAYSDFESSNIVGRITGSDPVLKNEFVFHSAHLDHVGVGKPVDGDSIYNGAHDNASGVACLIEIGKTYARLKVKPGRSIIVCFVTGEEMGLLGSGYFAKAPTVNIKYIVADINTDMPTIIAPFLSAVAIGAEHSSMSKSVTKAGEYLHIDIVKDPEPEQNRFVRSDQYSFVKAGIPAIHVKYGNKTADGNDNLDVKVKVWREKYYHKPQDGMNGIFDFEAGRTYSQFNFLISYFIAQDTMRPSWNTGSLFAHQSN